MALQFLKRISEFSPIPKGYGVAYYKPGFAIVVCAPIPFHRIIGFVRRCWHSYLVKTKPSIKDTWELESFLKFAEQLKAKEQTFKDLKKAEEITFNGK